MTSDEIIRMAREAGEAEGMRVVFHPVMERFAALVAAAEREACARVCEDIDEPVDASAVGPACAAAIRARSS